DAWVQSDGEDATCHAPEEAFRISKRVGTGIAVDGGTPHLVHRVDNLHAPRVEEQGSIVSTGPLAENATFYALREDRIGVRTFERGVGETASCGTGAIAAHLASRLNGDYRQRDENILHFTSGENLRVCCEN